MATEKLHDFNWLTTHYGLKVTFDGSENSLEAFKTLALLYTFGQAAAELGYTIETLQRPSVQIGQYTIEDYVPAIPGKVFLRKESGEGMELNVGLLDRLWAKEF